MSLDGKEIIGSFLDKGKPYAPFVLYPKVKVNSVTGTKGCVILSRGLS